MFDRMRMATIEFIEFVVHSDETDEMQIDVFFTFNDLIPRGIDGQDVRQNVSCVTHA